MGIIKRRRRCAELARLLQFAHGSPGTCANWTGHCPASILVGGPLRYVPLV